MGLFRKNSKQEARERAKWIASKNGLADEAIEEYRKGKADRESVRRELARHDDYFRYTDDED